MRLSGQIDRRGALSQAVLAKVRAPDNENISGNVVADRPDVQRSLLTVSLWMTVSVCAVIFGVLVAQSIDSKGKTFSLNGAVASILAPGGAGQDAGSLSRFSAFNSGNLKSRSSFASEEAFRRSESFRIAEIAAKSLPLALYCKNRIAVGTIKSVLGTVTGKDPYHAEVLAIRLLSRHKSQLGYSPADCSRRLPAEMAGLYARM